MELSFSAEGGRDLGLSTVHLRNANGVSMPSGRKVMVSYDVLGSGGCVTLHAQTRFVQSDVKRPLLSVGTLTMSGAEVKFGSKGSSRVQRVPVRVKGKNFGLTIQKTDAWIIPENSDQAPRAVVAPVEEEISRTTQTKLRRDRGHKRLKACDSSEKPVTLQQLGRARDSGDNRSAREDSSDSNVEDMRNRLSALGAPVWGTKAQMWPRLVHAEARRELQKRDEARLADRIR